MSHTLPESRTCHSEQTTHNNTQRSVLAAREHVSVQCFDGNAACLAWPAAESAASVSSGTDDRRESGTHRQSVARRFGTRTRPGIPNKSIKSRYAKKIEFCDGLWNYGQQDEPLGLARSSSLSYFCPSFYPNLSASVSPLKNLRDFVAAVVVVAVCTAP